MNRTEELKKNLIEVMHEDETKAWDIALDLIKEKNLGDEMVSEANSVRTETENMRKEMLEAHAQGDLEKVRGLVKESTAKRTDLFYKVYVA